jgi:hypothetical protein
VVGHVLAGVAVVQVEGEPALDPDHAFDTVHGADQVWDEAAPLGPALQDNHPVVDVDDEAAGSHSEFVDHRQSLHPGVVQTPGRLGEGGGGLVELSLTF